MMDILLNLLPHDIYDNLQFEMLQNTYFKLQHVLSFIFQRKLGE